MSECYPLWISPLFYQERPEGSIVTVWISPPLQQSIPVTACALFYSHAPLAVSFLHPGFSTFFPSQMASLSFLKKGFRIIPAFSQIPLVHRFNRCLSGKFAVTSVGTLPSGCRNPCSSKRSCHLTLLRKCVWRLPPHVQRCMIAPKHFATQGKCWVAGRKDRSSVRR